MGLDLLDGQRVTHFWGGKLTDMGLDIFRGQRVTNF